MTFCPPTRGLVTADPAYKEAWAVGKWLNVKVTKLPLRPENRYATDVRAMQAADDMRSFRASVERITA